MNGSIGLRPPRPAVRTGTSGTFQPTGSQAPAPTIDPSGLGLVMIAMLDRYRRLHAASTTVRVTASGPQRQSRNWRVRVRLVAIGRFRQATTT